MNDPRDLFAATPDEPAPGAPAPAAERSTRRRRARPTAICAGAVVVLAAAAFAGTRPGDAPPSTSATPAGASAASVDAEGNPVVTPTDADTAPVPGAPDTVPAAPEAKPLDLPSAPVPLDVTPKPLSPSTVPIAVPQRPVSNSTPAPLPHKAPKDTDFRNYTYEDVPCAEGAVSVRDGVHHFADGNRLVVADVQRGDLTGDGQEDAVVTLHCAGASDTAFVQAFAADAGAPSGARKLPPLTFEDATLEAAGVEQVELGAARIDGGQLVTEWRGFVHDAPSCCPSVALSVRHTWAAPAWAIVGTPDARPI